jgi:hypothetical protein
MRAMRIIAAILPVNGNPGTVSQGKLIRESADIMGIIERHIHFFWAELGAIIALCLFIDVGAPGRTTVKPT